MAKAGRNYKKRRAGPEEADAEAREIERQIRSRVLVVTPPEQPLVEPANSPLERLPEPDASTPLELHDRRRIDRAIAYASGLSSAKQVNSGDSSSTHVASKVWIPRELERLRDDGEIPPDASRAEVARLIAHRMLEACRAGESVRPMEWKSIRNLLADWRLYSPRKA